MARRSKSLPDSQTVQYIEHAAQKAGVTDCVVFAAISGDNVVTFCNYQDSNYRYRVEYGKVIPE